MSRLTDELSALLGLGNSWYFALRGGAKIYISYHTAHAHAANYSDPRAVVLRRNDQRRYDKVMTFRPRDAGAKPTERRADCLAQAIEYITNTTGYDGEWKMTPYRDAWVPSRVYQRVMDLLKVKREEATAQAKS